MSDSSMMRWYPDREPDPRPIHGWDARLDPSVKADVTFREQDDPEGAQAWLDAQWSLGTFREPPEETPRMRSVPFPPENVRPPTTERMMPDQMRRIQALPDGQLEVNLEPDDTDWIPFQQGGWISGSCRFR